MADAVLDRRIEFAALAPCAGSKKHRIVAEAACCRAVRAGYGRASGLRRSAARDRRRCAAARSCNGNARCAARPARRATRRAAWRYSPRVSPCARRRSARKTGPARRSAHRRRCRNRRRAPADRKARAAWRALSSAFSTKVLPVSSRVGDAELALRDEFDVGVGEDLRAFRRACPRCCWRGRFFSCRGSGMGTTSPALSMGEGLGRR